MRIGIDARMYGPAQGGLGRYIEQLILNLEKLPGNDEYVIFLRRDNWGAYQPTNPRFTKVLADIPWYGWREQIQLPGILKRTKVDLMHFPHWNVPLWYRKNYIVTIHDLLLFHFPTTKASTLGPMVYWLKHRIFTWVITSAARRAKHIITTSEYSKNDIRSTLGVPKEKITVTYQAPTPLPAPTPSAVANQGITKPFVLYVGVAFPHKNLETLVRAWKLFKETYHTDHELVLIGKENYFYQRLLASQDWKTAPGVRYLGFVPDQELSNYYQQAALYVMPSRYEGYALPCLEALAHQLPVVSSNATCLPEVLEQAALYFDPTDERTLANTLYRGLTDESTRHELVAAGKEVLNRYSALTLAKETARLYQKNSG